MKCECGCGSETSIYRGKPARFLPWHHLRRKDQPRGSFPTGEKHYMWKGGRTTTNKGHTVYQLVATTGHPRQVAGRYVPEHVLVAEKALGHPLPEKAVIHHWDRNGLNNVGSNLLICEDQAYHELIHQRMTALETCGHANWKRCIYCKDYAPSDAMKHRPGGGNRQPAYFHRECHNSYHRDLRKRLKAEKAEAKPEAVSA
jgi:hypothetical protein